MDIKQVVSKLMANYGAREAFLGQQLITLSTSGQPCDVTFYNRAPLLDVTIDEKLGFAVLYGAGDNKVAEFLNTIRNSSGTPFSLNEIWTVNPMPKGGISKEELAAADLGLGDQAIGQNSETMRQMISQTYHCGTEAETEQYLRRFIAS